MMGDGKSPTGVGFIGGGRVTRVILGGWGYAGFWPGEVVVSDPDPAALEKVESVASEVRALRDDNPQAAAQPVVFLAAHPPVIRASAPDMIPAFGAETIVVSLAPKLTISYLIELFGGFARLARVIPNAPSIVGVGYNPTTFGDALSGEARATVDQLLGPLGDHPIVPESQLEAYAVLTAMGPTYLWPQLYQLLSLVTDFGLDADGALAGLERTLAGTVATMRAGFDVDEVMDLVSARPLASLEPQIIAGYQEKLEKVYEAIKP